ncbi:hypothetical protein A6R68_04215, partial [Neotoma lepida]
MVLENRDIAHEFSWPYAIQVYKFTHLYLPAGTTGEAPIQLSTFTEHEQQMTKLEKLTIQQESITYGGIELCKILANYTNKDLQNRLNSPGLLKKEHKQVMWDLQKLRKEISDALNKVKQLIEENESS